jgi:pre-rRNA-processing protein IPI1
MSLPSWYLTSSFASKEAYESFDNLLQPTLQSPDRLSALHCWRPEIGPDISEDFAQKFGFATTPSGMQYTLQELSDVASQTGGLADGDNSHSIDVNFVAVSSDIWSRQ